MQPQKVGTVLISLCGMMGSLVGGSLSDRCCQAKRGPVALLYAAMQLGALAGLTCTDIHDTKLAVVLFGVLSFFLFGALTLLMGAAAVELVDNKQVASTCSGILNGAQYLGSGLSAVGCGVAIQNAGHASLWPMLTLGPVLSGGGMLYLICVGRSA